MVMGAMVAKPKRAGGRALAVAVSAMFLSLAAAPAAAGEPAPALLLDKVADFGADLDSDGLFDYLVLKVPLSVGRADVYSLDARVLLQEGASALSHAAQKAYLDPGEQAVRLAFPGADLSSIPPRSQLVFRIILTDSSGMSVDARTFPALSVYSGSEFEKGPDGAVPRFSGLVREVPEPLDAGGSYGYLNITFEVVNLTTRDAEVSGSLNGAVRGTGLLGALDAMNRTGLVELRFDGGAIRRLDAPGPYDVTVWLSAFPGGETTWKYRTAPYNATDFDAPGPPVRITGNGTDSAQDGDGNGLHERLRIQLEVGIALEGAYSFRASLRLPDRLRAVQELLPRPVVGLDAPRRGNYTVAFDISGPLLRTLQLDGPYTVAVDAFSERVQYVSNGTYTTGAYLWSRFEPPELPARFAGTPSVEATDKDRNGLFDGLRVTAPAEVALAGPFQIAGVLTAGGRCLASAGSKLDLPAGQVKLVLMFDGAAIRQAGSDGPYAVVLYLAALPESRPGLGAYLPPDRLELQTKAFGASEFDKRPLPKRPPAPPAVPEVEVGEGTYLGRGPFVTAEVNRTAPDITFYYSMDSGRSARFRLVFTQLLAYSDGNSNGVWDPGEEMYQGLLSLGSWEASKAEVAGDDGGRTLRYNLTAVLDMSSVRPQAGSPQPQARIPRWGRLTLGFTMSGRDLELGAAPALTLRGGSEMKIDILIEPLRELPGPVTGLCLQHYLSDERGLNHFLTFESDRTRVFRPASEGANGSIFRPLPAAVQKIGLSGPGGREHGYYTWLSEVLVEAAGGARYSLPVNLSYSTDGRQMALGLNYPLPAGTVSLLHDPTVGVNATNAPGPPLSLPRIIFNPWLYILAALIAVAVTAYIRRSQRNGR